MSVWFCLSLYQWLCNFNIFCSQCLRHIPKLDTLNLLISRANVLKWNEKLFSLLVSLSEELFCLSCSLSVVGTKLENYLPVDCTGLFISPSGISEFDCATTKTDTAERSISIGRETLQVFFVLGVFAYFQVPPLRGSREEEWRSQ